MKNQLLLFSCFLFVGLDAHAISVGDSALYRTYFTQFPQASGSVLNTVTAVDASSGGFTYTQKMDEGKPHSFTEDAMVTEAFESVMETCDANFLLPVKGVKESITTPAGTFTVACHYIIDTYNEEYDIHHHRDVFIGKVPFYIIKDTDGTFVTLLVKFNQSKQVKE